MTIKTIIGVAVEPDSLFGKKVGFTSDLFKGYLWVDKSRVTISVIHSIIPGKGHLKRLFDNILQLGYEIAVLTPSGRMRNILEKNGFRRVPEYCEQMQENVEVWVKKAKDESEVDENEDVSEDFKKGFDFAIATIMNTLDHGEIDAPREHINEVKEAIEEELENMRLDR